MNELLYETIKDLWENKKLSGLRSTLQAENAVDIAEVLEALADENEKSLPAIYRLLPKELAAEVFVEFSGEVAERLIGALTDRELSDTIAELFYDDTADLIEEMPANVVKRILQNTTPADRAEINKLLKFSENSAGSIMTTEFVRLRKEHTVEEALAHIRAVALDKETVYNCYVTDKARRLLGIVTAKALLLSPYEAKIEDLMETNVISVTTETDREEVAQTLAKYNFLALPVVDSENRLVGIVTVDDAIDVIREETEEDFAKMAAMTPIETPYLRTSVFSIFKTRIPWLLLLMVSSTLTGMIISKFETALAANAILAMFIPMLMDTGGNCGSQSSTTVIRSLSLGDVKLSDVLRVVFKEGRVSLLCGVCLAALQFCKILTVDNWINGGGITVTVALAVSLALVVTVFFAKIIGAALPIGASAIGLDPAVMASPFITTLVDTISLLVYFMIASALLG